MLSNIVWGIPVWIWIVFFFSRVFWVVAGAIVGLIFSVGFQVMSMYELYKLPFGIIPAAPGIILSLLTIYVVSLLTKKTPMDEQMGRVVALPLVVRGI